MGVDLQHWVLRIVKPEFTHQKVQWEQSKIAKFRKTLVPGSICKKFSSEFLLTSKQFLLLKVNKNLDTDGKKTFPKLSRIQDHFTAS